MEKFLNIFKSLKIVDYVIIIGLILAVGVGYFTLKGTRQTANRSIEATSKISFDVVIRGITFTGEELPLKSNEKTFISIRNVPYSDLIITDVKSDRRKIVLPTFNTKDTKTVLVVDDVALPNVYDATVTLSDTAKITKDGAVVGGNKIKIGLPITLEGKDYRLNGTVSNIKLINGAEEVAKDQQLSAVENVQ
ncbi:DUF4330 domain-containing protein [bacterium]|nr:DUF4330 domain-containing protein [bacterium]